MSYLEGVWVGGRLKANGNQYDLIDWPQVTPSSELIKMMTLATIHQQWEVLKVYDWMFQSVDVVDSWWLRCQIN